MGGYLACLGPVHDSAFLHASGPFRGMYDLLSLTRQYQSISGNVEHLCPKLNKIMKNQDNSSNNIAGFFKRKEK